MSGNDVNKLESVTFNLDDQKKEEDIIQVEKKDNNNDNNNNINNKKNQEENEKNQNNEEQKDNLININIVDDNPNSNSQINKEKEKKEEPKINEENKDNENRKDFIPIGLEKIKKFIYINPIMQLLGGIEEFKIYYYNNSERYEKIMDVEKKPILSYVTSRIYYNFYYEEEIKKKQLYSGMHFLIFYFINNMKYL